MYVCFDGCEVGVVCVFGVFDLVCFYGCWDDECFGVVDCEGFEGVGGIDDFDFIFFD